MKRIKNARGLTIVELLSATLILMLAGIALLGFIRTSFGAQDTISGQNGADINARQALDVLADNIRNAQWFNPYDPNCTGGCGSGTKSAVVAANATSITLYRSSLNGGQTLRYALSGTNLQKSVDGGIATTILPGVQSLNLQYYRDPDYINAITPAAADYPYLGAIRITAVVSVTQLNTYTQQFQTYVRLRNSPGS